MNKLTADKCREIIGVLRFHQSKLGELSIQDEYKLQAMEIALEKLEEQECGNAENNIITTPPHILEKKWAEHFGLNAQPTTDTYRQIENDGWIEWRGGDCPVNPMAIVEVKFTLTPQGEGIANWWDWHHGEGENNIIAYRVIENDGREG